MKNLEQKWHNDHLKIACLSRCRKKSTDSILIEWVSLAWKKAAEYKAG